MNTATKTFTEISTKKTIYFISARLEVPSEDKEAVDEAFAHLVNLLYRCEQKGS